MRILNKLGQYGLVFWLAVSLNFCLPRLMPGSPLKLLVGEDIGLLTAAQRAEALASVGLDQPLLIQYLLYWRDLFQGNWGFSFQRNVAVSTLLAERLPWTLLLGGSSLVLSTLIGVGLGAWAAWQRGRGQDVGLLGLVLLLESLPTFWLGMVLLGFFAVHWQLFPSFGAMSRWVSLSGWAWIQDILRHLALPLLTLTLTNLSRPFLVTRYALLEVMGEDYIRVARAKGLPEQVVLLRHALRNALLPVVTVVALNLAFALAGATVVETVFAYPGLGRLTYEAVLARDYPVLQATFLLVTVLVILANSLADLLYPVLDPRLRER
ncbi:MAG: ABC transporter permease [Thermostichus sp. HHBFW_bins_43]